MANMCSVTIAFQGQENDLKVLENDLKNMKQKVGADKNWLGNIIYDDADIHCASFVEYVSLDDNCLFVDVSSKWTPDGEAYEYIANKYGLEYEYVAEEPGCGVFINTDTEGKTFSQEYYVTNNNEECFMEGYEKDSLDGVKKDFINGCKDRIKIDEEMVLNADFETLKEYLSDFDINLYKYENN